MGRKRSSQKPATPSPETETVAVETAADTNTAEVTETAADDDAELDAALALLADEASTESVVEPVADPEIEMGEDVALDTSDEPVAEEGDEEVEPEPEDVDAALAALEADDSNKPASRSRTKGTGTATPAVAVRAWEDVAALPKSELDARVAGTSAKKVVEKAQNLISVIEGRKSNLSKYTQAAVKLLAADGKVTGKSLTEMFQANNLSIGTARAQSQQMTALFKIVGAAEPSPTAPRELVLADQGLVDELVKLAA